MCILLIWYWPLLTASEATTASKQPWRPNLTSILKSVTSASEVKYALRWEISDPNYLLVHVQIFYMVWAFLAASEATTASKQPWRSKWPPFWNCLTSITSTPFAHVVRSLALLSWEAKFCSPPLAGVVHSFRKKNSWAFNAIHLRVTILLQHIHVTCLRYVRVLDLAFRGQLLGKLLYIMTT